MSRALIQQEPPTLVTLVSSRLVQSIVQNKARQVPLLVKAVAPGDPRYSLFIQKVKPRWMLISADPPIDHLFPLVQEARMLLPSIHIILLIPGSSFCPLTIRLIRALDPDSVCRLEELTSCFEEIVKGNPFVTESLTDLPAADEVPRGWQDLSQREQLIFRYLTNGWSARQISEVLHIAGRTVENYKARITQKLNVHGGPGCLLRFASAYRNRLPPSE